MKIEIKEKYLIFPVNTMLTPKKMTFSDGNETVLELDVRLDNLTPDFYAYVDVARFIGKTLTVSIHPETEISYKTSDILSFPDLYREPFRPQVHFSTKNGWINDPNGLVYINGEYHLFYQHNPCDHRWGNMHWGHAVSKDLIHWEEKEIALFPDETGMMFSGSAIVDQDNRLGLQETDVPTVLLFYTATKPFAQYIAYSTDGLKTIHKYQKEPVIPHIEAENRDPKIVWCDELDAYLLALYLSGNEYALLTSDNFVDWKLLEKVTLPGDCECPDIFPITDQHGNRKWVLYGASSRYLVGDFTNGHFVPSQEVRSLHYGASAYAGQTFSNVQDGRIIHIAWNIWYLPVPRFAGQMGIPVELTLEECDGTHYLCANPVSELESLFKDDAQYSKLCLNKEEEKQFSLNKGAYFIKASANCRNQTALTFTIFGRSFVCDFSKNAITLGDRTAPLSMESGKLDLTLICDACSMEIFSDGGKSYLSSVADYTVCDYNVPKFLIKASENCEIETLEIHALDTIWK